MQEIQPLHITADEEGLRLDKYLTKKFPSVNFSFVQKMCRKGQVRLNGKRVKGTERLKLEDEVRVNPAFYQAEEGVEKLSEYRLSAADKAMIESAIIYEDDDILVLNKPEGVPVQAGSGHTRSIDRMMVAMYPEDTPRLAHRLDRDTTGCLVLGKKRQVVAAITEGFKHKNWQKTYLALATGTLDAPEGEIDFDLEKGIGSSEKEKMQVTDSGGLSALTRYKRIARSGAYHLLEVMPETGRTHQIRAHLGAIGVPILGDHKYGTGKTDKLFGKSVKKLFLHAYKIEFTHPVSQVRMQFKAALPKYYQETLDNLKIKI